MKTRRHLPTLALALVVLGVLGSFAVSRAQQAGLGFLVPHVFQPGTPALSSQVNENFQAIADELDRQHERIRVNEDALANAGSERAEQLVIVAKQGGDFASVADAVDSIRDASADKPYAVVVHPGVYEESRLVRVPSFVHLRGVAREACVIRVERSANANSPAAAAVEVRDLAALSDLTILNEGSAAISVGVFCSQVGRDGLLDNLVVRADGDGGVGHIAVMLLDSDVRVRDSRLFAAGASTVNSALGSNDTANAFAQPLIEDCELQADGIDTGIALQLIRTAATVRGCTLDGDFRGISASVAGISRVFGSLVQTLGLNASMESTGSASVLSASTQFVGGNFEGDPSRFKFVGCLKPNFDPIDDGFGSEIEP